MQTGLLPNSLTLEVTTTVTKNGGRMLTGSCLCGGIRYEIRADLESASNCHCSQCRKASGTAFASTAAIPADAFHFVTGENLLKEWESSPGIRRCFCGRCGSPILKRNNARPETIRLRLGTLDSDPGVKPSKHIYTASKAPWFEITDGLPQSE
jgi:hypothetical protein